MFLTLEQFMKCNLKKRKGQNIVAVKTIKQFSERKDIHTGEALN